MCTQFISYAQYHSSCVFFHSCLKNIIMHWDAKKVFQILPFYNTFTERPEIKKLSYVKLLQELPFTMS